MQTLSLGLAQEQPAPDEPAVTRALIELLRGFSAREYPAGLVRRFAHPRHVGCVEAEFVVGADLPANLRVGIFAEPRRFRALIRFGNNRFESDAKKDIRGMSIKIFDVPGERLLPDEPTQDFVLISADPLVVGTPPEFYRMLRAIVGGNPLAYFLHPLRPRIGALRRAIASRRHHSSHLAIGYWSTTPYLFGAGRAVKYAARPSEPIAAPPRSGPNGLRAALHDHLAARPASFDFLVQFQADPRAMPIEDASVAWDEAASPFAKVATVMIPPQPVDTPERLARGEDLAFNPWHSLAEHRPLGGINRVRREVYAALAADRRQRNAINHKGES